MAKIKYLVRLDECVKKMCRDGKKSHIEKVGVDYFMYLMLWFCPYQSFRPNRQ